MNPGSSRFRLGIIYWRKRLVPEIVVNDKTGFVVRDLSEAVAAVELGSDPSGATPFQRPSHHAVAVSLRSGSLTPDPLLEFGKVLLVP